MVPGWQDLQHCGSESVVAHLVGNSKIVNGSMPVIMKALEREGAGARERQCVAPRDMTGGVLK
jgi:hypothetical protein